MQGDYKGFFFLAPAISAEMQQKNEGDDATVISDQTVK